MPLIRNASDKRDPLPRAGADIEAALLRGSTDDRWTAARAIADTPNGLQILATALAQETDPRVREAILTRLVRIATPESAALLLPYLQSDDAGIRMAALDALRAMPAAAQPHLTTLLAHPDADVRVLACEILREVPAAHATAMLCAMLDTEQVGNVCGAAVDVLAEIGTQDALPALMRCVARFRGNPFLDFAIEAAVDRLRALAPTFRG
jgi:HEAT repeat protein